MSFAHKTLANRLKFRPPLRWVVTGAAGFVGSNLVEALLSLGQCVTAVDDFSESSRASLEAIASAVERQSLASIRIIESNIVDLTACMQFCEGADYVLHQAARASVPGSIDEPIATHDANATGFLNMILAARDSRVKRFVYASSSAIYGDTWQAACAEKQSIAPMSPYAATKAIDETYAAVFANCYGTASIGLRYFNIFGRRQRHLGQHVAVIPQWICAMLRGEPNIIHGDGESSRDFCFVDDVVQANLLAAIAKLDEPKSQIYNVASGYTTTLNRLDELLRQALAIAAPTLLIPNARRTGFRNGDVHHSSADISQARALLGFEPTTNLPSALLQTVKWYQELESYRTSK